MPSVVVAVEFDSDPTRTGDVTLTPAPSNAFTLASRLAKEKPIWFAPLPSLGPVGWREKNRNSVVPHWAPGASFGRLGAAWHPMFLMYHCAPSFPFGTVRCM